MVVPVRFLCFRVWADQRPVSEKTSAVGQPPIVSFAGREPGQHRHSAVSPGMAILSVWRFIAAVRSAATLPVFGLVGWQRPKEA